MGNVSAAARSLRQLAVLLWVLALVLALVATVPTQLATAHAAASTPSHPEGSQVARATSPARPSVVTLITGDTVRLTPFPDGKFGVAFERANQGAPGAFIQYTDAAGDLHVVPDSVAGLVPAALDPALFNVSELVRQGYDDASIDALPLIVTYDEAPTQVPGVESVRRLESIDGASVTLDKDGAQVLGEAFAAVSTSAASGGDGFLPGVEKIWLDGKVEALLDSSVPQIGAPAAWGMGLDGTGTTVAVLDTGIDAEHPDLAGKVADAFNFSDSETVTDVNGHGTHVASTVAGTGAASGGLYTGVAYGATLFNGKVLDDFGFGQDSWVIAGMEWAASDKDADVVNMSLGSFPTDGTDPVSQALNQLSADHGTLFVVSAGNFGYGNPETVSAPATADAALAVGAVDSADVLADFSALGPRVGDLAVKPEITAPGVEIVAARADGSSLGPPVGEDYMSLTGTSMAAPHVAGAAALLAQQHPDWSGEQLKAALVTSAATSPDYTVYEQGGGRVHVEAAVTQQVHTDEATLNLGILRYPHDDGETSTATATYTNPSDEPVTLGLELDVQDEDGNAAAPGLVTMNPATMTVPAGGSAQSDVTVDPVVGAFGLYSGYLTAVDATGAELLHTPLGFYKEPEVYDLTIEAIPRPGGSELFGLINVMNVDNREEYFEQFFVDASQPGPFSTRVPPGTYSASLQTGQQTTYGFELTQVDEPQFDVTTATTVTLDSRDTVEVVVDVGEDVSVTEGSLSTYREAVAGGGFSSTFGGGGFPDIRAFAKSTDTVTVGFFEFYSKWMLTAPGTLYELIFPEPQQVPAALSYMVGPDDVAQLDTAFHTHVPEHTYGVSRFSFRPYEVISSSTLHVVTVPMRRREFVSAGDTTWRRWVEAGEGPFSGMLEEPRTMYQPGEQRDQAWFEQPVRPGAADNDFPSVREGDTLLLSMFPFMDADGHYGFEDPGFDAPSIDDVDLRLFADGELIAEADTSFGFFDLLPGSAEYEIEVDVARTADWWRMSTDTSTVWTFDSQTPPAGEQDVIPLLQVDYGIDLDLLNQTVTPTLITLDVYHQPGAAQVPIEGLQLWASLGDGGTWTAVELDDLGDGGFEATIDAGNPELASGFVSLRLEATDVEGNAIEQTIIRAYELKPNTIETLDVTPAEAQVAPGGTQQFTATATYSDGREEDVTDTASWSSSEPEVATVIDTGLAEGLADGQTTITAALASIEGELVDQATLTVATAPEPPPEPPPGPPVEPPVQDPATRVSGTGRVETAVGVSRASFADGEADTVVLARADSYADALAGTPLAVAANGPLLITVSDDLLGVVAEEIRRVLPAAGTVHVLGGEAALATSVEDDLVGLGYDVVRIFGQTRIQTALGIADFLGDPGDLMVATGYDYPDALTAGTAAGHVGGAVLLTTSEAPHPDVDAYLDEHGGDLWGVGGPAARAYPEATPLVGATRDETAVVVGRQFFTGAAVAGFARADAFPDALTGGAHIGRLGGPMLLAYPDLLPGSTQAYACDQAASITEAFVYGGTTAIGDPVLAEIAERINGQGCD